MRRPGLRWTLAAAAGVAMGGCNLLLDIGDLPGAPGSDASPADSTVFDAAEVGLTDSTLEAAVNDASVVGRADAASDGDSGHPRVMLDSETDQGLEDARPSSMDAGTACAMCADACVNTRIDQRNCGACGHDCRGVPCEGGVCEPTPLATGQNTSGPLAVSTSAVYWTTWGAADAGGAVMQVPLNGGTPVAAAPAQTNPKGLVLDSNGIYWANSGAYGQENTGTIMTMPAGGGTPRALVSGQTYPWQMALDGTNVYWTNATTPGTVMTAVRASGATSTVGTGSNPDYVAVSPSGTVYWSNSEVAGSISYAQRDGTGLGVLVPSTDNPFGIAVNSIALFWATSDSTGGGVQKIPLTGGSVTPLDTGTTVSANELAIDATNVYWTDPTGLVMRVPIAGGAAVTLATGQRSAQGIAVDSTSVYWTTVPVLAGDGTVMKVAK